MRSRKTLGRSRLEALARELGVEFDEGVHSSRLSYLVDARLKTLPPTTEQIEQALRFKLPIPVNDPEAMKRLNRYEMGFILDDATARESNRVFFESPFIRTGGFVSWRGDIYFLTYVGTVDGYLVATMFPVDGKSHKMIRLYMLHDATEEEPPEEICDDVRIRMKRIQGE